VLLPVRELVVGQAKSSPRGDTSGGLADADAEGGEQVRIYLDLFAPQLTDRLFVPMHAPLGFTRRPSSPRLRGDDLFLVKLHLPWSCPDLSFPIAHRPSPASLLPSNARRRRRPMALPQNSLAI
jgi:hypothetical protein